MILEMSNEDIIILLEDPLELKKVVEEATQLLSQPPSLSSRILSSGADPGFDTATLGVSESQSEGGRTDEQKKL